MSGLSDVLVVGGGIAGAAAGYFLGRSGGRVTLLEAERTPGTHATGRSAALFSEYYGNTVVRELTVASRAFYERPPAGFSPVTELLRPRGVLALGTPDTGREFDAAKASGATAPQPAVELDRDQALALCPALRPGAFDRALYKPGARDIDTDAVLQGFLRGLKAAGGTVVTGARVHGLAFRRGQWHATTAAGEFSAPVVVDAAGAWADQVAVSAGAAVQGLVSYRRTAALASLPEDRASADRSGDAGSSGHPGPPHPRRPGTEGLPGGTAAGIADWPMISDVADTFYARPESGGLLVSPADATPVPPGDVRPDDRDVALALDRFRAVVALPVRHVRRAWAGLRTSTPDDTPVIGPDPDAPGFCWLAGLGGYGLQTAPAAGALLAALIAGHEPPPGLTTAVAGVTPARTGRS
ncbi:NAD(P)/FAD-dependent oxidoreductase [Streptomyces europaeiscabiei]|uniref:NAD(P)/FAD-dependent oxidoreductase n=2 Tax=Streptomyces europaeiscabiei TaxID=146819 RepID=UPI0006282F3C|nr:FAD-dependent oxidoreductase [Streptomyces europaeiscabiei]MDX2524715.1 FAD-dependent oxidoreductase [Streptomyces europaeiscabiei]MDX2759971.1 FAD-dependent oxidoreductase [Streptomyces europaeiscabiei]MDX3783518.1 FAD-dependent oxidoreductase [Streptomyces europaeiscabiei]MDX3866329.1 FAD-dependent oxidoreductase [Streptomyces europaeiscabiei]MDX3876433.1 FAD-dependent oxidoreductase [Streptomyces europaeiscabiei]